MEQSLAKNFVSQALLDEAYYKISKMEKKFEEEKEIR
jgi:hypothetical protein